jgi:hypothetical protein
MVRLKLWGFRDDAVFVWDSVTLWLNSVFYGTRRI